MRTRRWIVTRTGAWGLMLCIAVTGCASPGKPHQPVRLAAMSRNFAPDIPVPVGFRFVEPQSEDVSTGTKRLYLRHVYVGSPMKYDVRSFYDEEMPQYGWVKVHDGNVKGEYTMRFEKGNESCNILLRDRGGWQGGTEVQVIVTQEQRGVRPPGPRNRQ